ncbi:MAG TPA: hypothetical protein VFG52_02725, partial [Xanthomonadales bacterium]|nr:hypothetical protein [Xanthomonadales bacterium]
FIFDTNDRCRAAVFRALTVLAVGLILSTPGFAQNDCRQNDLGERLSCKLERAAEQQAEAAMMVSQFEEVPEAQKMALMNQTSRGMNAHGRSTPGQLKQLARDTAKACEIAELMDGSGDGDGVCEGSENCQELIGDGIGDDDGVCRTKGKPTEREVCIEFCSAEADPEDDGQFDMALGKDIEEGLDDVIVLQESANHMIAQALNQRSSVQNSAQAETEGDSDPDPCTMPPDRTFNRPNEAFVASAMYANIAAEGVADGFWVGCSQDVAGFNTATACIVTTIIKVGASALAETLSFIDGNHDSDGIDATWGCVQKLKQQVFELDQQMGQISGDLEAIMSGVEAIQEQLATPQGRRDGFPDG